MPRKSGKYWVVWAHAHATNSHALNDLDPDFRKKASAFIKALKAAGATVTIATTKRSKKRAYLFHWAWKIALGKCKASDAGKMAGVDIEWDHGTQAKSKAGALEMVHGFGLAVPPRSVNPPSLTSNHIAGKAIDMVIKWSGTLTVEKKNGDKVAVNYLPNVNANLDLQAVGASYGVKKLKTDAPHWSFNGR